MQMQTKMLNIFLITVIISYLLIVDGFVYEKDYRNITRFKRQTECSTAQFECDSEQCIEDWQQCDGVNNCDDGSDETADLCSSLNCPPSSFKCAYGACIFFKWKCNGIKNCRDNSDEEGCPDPKTPIVTPITISKPKPEENYTPICTNTSEGRPKCIMCGQRTVEAVKLLIDSKDVPRGEFPWHVALYQVNEHFCGGSLITLNLVLTAAHCLDSNSTEIYLVAAGKYYRALNHTDDDQAQYSKVSDIIIHEYYKDHSFEAYDIAVVVLADPFKLSKYVLPVCLDNFDMSSLKEKGIVVGWGYTQETSTPAEHLKYLEVDYKTKDKCTLPNDFLRYYIPNAPDKLCAGLLNQGKSACRGDSGGGLVFRADNGLYFLGGIVSLGPRKGRDCDSNALSLYTSVQYHVEFIEKLKNKYRV